MTRAPVKLSREMKLLLGLLLLVAAIGLWYVLTNRGAAPEVQNPVTPTDTVPVTTPEKPEGNATPGTGVDSSGQVDVEVIPPFPTDGSASTSSEPEPEDTPPTPAGINPAGTLAAVPGNNPFRPLSLESADTGSTPTASAPEPISVPASTPTTVNTPVASTPRITPIQTGGALGLNAIPGSTGATSSGAGPLPIPTIPGADGGNNPPVVTPLNPGGTVAVTPAAPVKPPVAGVNVPALTRVPASVTTPAGQGGAGTTPGTTPAPTLPTSAPTPGTPEVISEVGSVTSGTTTTATTLDTFVQTQQLAFNAVVLGPVNTAIFRSKDGYVVVAVGQTLPDSQVTVKEVTATGATLSLGNDSKTLELDKR